MIALAEALRDKPPAKATRLVRENHCSVLLDGGANVAYVVSIQAVDKAIEIARKNGIAVVCANNTWFSGRLAYCGGRSEVTHAQRCGCRGTAASGCGARIRRRVSSK